MKKHFFFFILLLFPLLAAAQTYKYIGVEDGLSNSIQFIGDCFKEKNIIRAAYAFEQSREFVNWSLNGKEEK